MHKVLQSDPRYQSARLGGEDIFAGPIRGHLWESDQQVSSDRHRQKFLILPGFTEFCEKYAHVAQKIVSQGDDCLIIDWPGQGRSGHLGTTPLMVHCDSFADHIRALQNLLVKAGWQRQKFHIVAHSMGGHLALLAASRLNRNVQTMVLSAPMILPRPRPSFAIRLLGLVLGALGQNRKYSPFTKVPNISDLQHFTDDNLLTTDVAGYLWQTHWFFEAPELRRYGASVGWVREAYRSSSRYAANPSFLEDIKMPILILMAEKEQVVSNSKIAFAAKFLPQSDLITIKQAKHELFNETLEIDANVWDHIFRFWQRNI